MQLYLLRHADADTEAATDDERYLSEKGLAQAQRVARFCEAHSIHPEFVLSSPLRRAQETGKIVASHLHAEHAITPVLASGMHPTAALVELKKYLERESLMIVGHEPDFSQLAAFLLGLPTQVNIHIRKSSLTLLEVESLKPGTARLEYSVPCKLM